LNGKTAQLCGTTHTINRLFGKEIRRPLFANACESQKGTFLQSISKSSKEKSKFPDVCEKEG